MKTHIYAKTTILSDDPTTKVEQDYIYLVANRLNLASQVIFPNL